MSAFDFVKVVRVLLFMYVIVCFVFMFVNMN